MDRVERNNFDGLRLAAALCVVVSHEFALSGRWQPQTGQAVSVATLGLAAFFAISGYLVAGSWKADPHLGRFAARRALRIGPALAVFCVVAAFLPEFRGNPVRNVNGSLWTIPLEVQCYVALAGLALVSGRWLPKATVYAAGLMVLAVAAGGPWSLLALGSFFAMGSIAHSFSKPLPFAVAGLVAYWLTGDQMLGLIVGLPVALVWVGSQSWPGLRDAGRFGDLSYGVYIWAWPAQQMVVAWLGKDRPYLVLLGVTLAILFPLAALSWHAVEKPALKLKPSRRAPVRLAVGVDDGVHVGGCAPVEV